MPPSGDAPPHPPLPPHTPPELCTDAAQPETRLDAIVKHTVMLLKIHRVTRCRGQGPQGGGGGVVGGLVGGGVGEYLDLWALGKEGVEFHPVRGDPRGEQVLEDAFGSPQHLRCGAVVVPQLQCLSPCHVTHMITEVWRVIAVRKGIALAEHATS